MRVFLSLVTCICGIASASKWDTDPACQGKQVSAGDCAEIEGFSIGGIEKGSKFIFTNNVESDIADERAPYLHCSCGFRDGEGLVFVDKPDGNGDFNRECTRKRPNGCGTAMVRVYCDEPSFVQITTENKQEYGMKMGQQGETGGNDDSFWLSIDDGRDAMYAFASGGKRHVDDDGTLIGVWHTTKVPISRIFSKGDHTLLFREREDGAYMRKLTITDLHGTSSCRFGTSKYAQPDTTTAAATTTTEDPAVTKLQAQLDELSANMNSATREYVEKEVQLAVTKVTDAYAARFQEQQNVIDSLNAERKAEEQQLATAVQVLQDGAAQLFQSLQLASEKAIGEDEGNVGDGGGANTCGGGCDPVPSVGADGTNLMLSAAGGDVMVESLQCGAVSVCELQQTVDNLAAAIGILGGGN